MSESIIELARTEVQAISVKVGPDPTALEKVDELMLQANADGTVQIDVFGTNPQGGPFHESSAVAEEQYERLRQVLLKKELATLPPFSSFKSGNTLGRVVGEASAAQVGATAANTPTEPETEEEGWWAHVRPWVHGTLDGLGFIPGLGAVPDGINAILYAAQGDLISAGVSAFGAIPIIGDAAKGGVLVGKSAHRIGKRTPSPPKKTESGGKATGNGKCILLPYRPNRCKKGLAGHHVVPDRAFRQGTRGSKNRKQISGGLSEADGLVICVNALQHTKIHKIYDKAETELGRIEKPPGTTNLIKLETLGASSVSRITGCSKALLMFQMRAYHESKGLDAGFKVRADKRGNITRQLHPEALGNHSTGDF